MAHPADLRVSECAADAKTDALSRIDRALAEAAERTAADTLHATVKALKKAVNAYKKQDWREAAVMAAEAADLDPNSATSFHLMALALDNLGHMSKALEFYQRAVDLDPADADIYLNVGLAAWKMEMLPAAEKAFRLYIELRPNCWKGYNNLGGALRDQGHMDGAVEIVRNAIYRLPEVPELWNTLGTIMSEASDFPNADVFYAEALRLDPKAPRVWHNRGYALNHTGPLEEALQCYDRALSLNPLPGEEVEITHARGLCAAGLGRLKEGWRDYEARHDPAYKQSTGFAVDAPVWAGEDIAGKRLLVVGEQGLGDEIMFASMIPDLIERVGPDGEVAIACDQRLVPLYARSFPKAYVGPQFNTKHLMRNVRLVPWNAGAHKADYYTPCGSPLQFIRERIEDFYPGRGYLKPDPERVAYWRARLEASGRGPFVGLCWKSMFLTTQRRKYFGALRDWAPVLEAPGVTFVNLQYGDCRAELDAVQALLGVEILNFTDLDLKDALDDNAALCAALDLTVSAPTAAAALCAATGTETWFLVAGRVWPQLGSDHYPWYARSRVIAPETFGDWTDLMSRTRSQLEGWKR